MFHLAYVFERFPSFTQTFCVREVLQLERMGVRPLVFSIRDTRDEGIRHFPKELFDRVHFLPAREQLIEQVRQWKDAHLLPRAAGLVLRHWEERPDKMRVYEAAYMAKVIADLGAARSHHVHSHFAGIGADFAQWVKNSRSRAILQFGIGVSIHFGGKGRSMLEEAEKKPQNPNRISRKVYEEDADEEKIKTLFLFLMIIILSLFFDLCFCIM